MIGNRLVFEVRGTQLYNKGAELMLRACISEIKLNYPDAVICTAPNGKAPYERRAPLGLYQKFWVRRGRLTIGRWGAWIPAALRTRFGLVLDREVDVLLDASGYCLGDHWSVRRNLQAATDVQRIARRGGTAVLLPQAMGPFTGPAVRKTAQKALDAAQLIYARDGQSFDGARGLIPDADTLHLAPDFTGTVRRESGISEAAQVVVIPNIQMVQKTEPAVGIRYVQWLRDVIRLLEESGVTVAIYLHDTLEDRPFGPDGTYQLSSTVACLTEEDALLLKSRIGKAGVVLSSRYHGAVNALSQGVPVFVTSWSHKYEALLADYGVSDSVLSVNDEPAAATQRILAALKPEEQKRTKQLLATAIKGIEDKTAEMWGRVFALIRSRHGRDPQ